MGLRASFSVTQDLGYRATTTHYHWPIDYSEGCDVFIDTFLEVSNNLVPVDTGYLRSRLDASTDGDEVTCEDDCDYAQYVEYGTIRMGAQPYFEPAIEQAYNAARPVWNEALQEAQQADQETWMEEQQMKAGGGAGGGLGGFLGMIFAAIIIGVVNVLLNIITGEDGNSSGGHGRIGIEIT